VTAVCNIIHQLPCSEASTTQQSAVFEWKTQVQGTKSIQMRQTGMCRNTCLAIFCFDGESCCVQSLLDRRSRQLQQAADKFLHSCRKHVEVKEHLVGWCSRMSPHVISCHHQEPYIPSHSHAVEPLVSMRAITRVMTRMMRMYLSNVQSIVESMTSSFFQTIILKQKAAIVLGKPSADATLFVCSRGLWGHMHVYTCTHM
jgi:hypothetical protein